MKKFILIPFLITLVAVGVFAVTNVVRGPKTESVFHEALEEVRQGQLPSAKTIGRTFQKTLCEADFAVIGDFGQAGPDEAAVATLVKSWQPDFVATVGDNNYPDGEASTIDANIGQYYHEFIFPYKVRRLIAFSPRWETTIGIPKTPRRTWHTLSCPAMSGTTISSGVRCIFLS